LVNNPDPVIVEGNQIDAIFYHDIQGSYTFGESEQRYNITVGVKNLTDKQPPIITGPARTQSSGSNTVVGGVYDIRGRFVYLNLSVSL